MIRSMTGYGSASFELEPLRAAVTVRSVNHRFLEQVGFQRVILARDGAGWQVGTQWLTGRVQVGPWEGP